MKLRHSFAMSHLYFTYRLTGDFIVPFVLERDDLAGDSIAARKRFSEMRGHYWLWRNKTFLGDECVSIQQYRRCFWFPHLVGRESKFWPHVEALSKNLGQQILHMNRADYIEYVQAVDGADLDPLNRWLAGTDIVVSRAIEYPKTIAQIYGEHHRAQDWEIFAAICREHGLDDGRHPWLTGHLMYMMAPALFAEFMELWWQVAQEVDALLEPNTDLYQHRQLGYLTERFLSAWLIKMRVERPTLRIQTLPIVEGLFQMDRPHPGVM